MHTRSGPLRGHRVTSAGAPTRAPRVEPKPLMPRPEDADRLDAGAWRRDAACRGSGAERFYPEDESALLQEAVRAAAKRVCSGCPVADECLSYALRYQERYGVWGGLTPDERRELEQLSADLAAQEEVSAA